MNEIKSASETSIKKAVIYARFSTDLQNERSIEDQITLCRDYASRQGINIIEVYEDKARSGGSIMGRDGSLLAKALGVELHDARAWTRRQDEGETDR